MKFVVIFAIAASLLTGCKVASGPTERRSPEAVSLRLEDVRDTSQQHAYYYPLSVQIADCIKIKAEACEIGTTEATLFQRVDGDMIRFIGQGRGALSPVRAMLAPYGAYEFEESIGALPRPVRSGDPYDAQIYFVSDDINSKLASTFHYAGGRLLSVSFSSRGFVRGELG